MREMRLQTGNYIGTYSGIQRSEFYNAVCLLTELYKGGNVPIKKTCLIVFFIFLITITEKLSQRLSYDSQL